MESTPTASGVYGDAENKLPEDDFEQIEVLFDLLSESNSLHSAAAFIHGYQIPNYQSSSLDFL
ncbi:hypothetical protein OIU26_09555 [Paenibacillus sp. BT-177]|nr:hypothetical protein [Paenibacillus sp. BT-177]